MCLPYCKYGCVKKICYCRHKKKIFNFNQGKSKKNQMELAPTEYKIHFN